MPFGAQKKLNYLSDDGFRYLMLGITLYLSLMLVNHWCILVLYVNRLSRVAAVNLIHWIVLPSLNTSSTVFLWDLWNCPNVPRTMALCMTMLCVLYVA